jgi:diamine N-acetyltransferase
MATEERPIYNIEGELVALGPISREFIPTYLRWFNDFLMTKNLSARPGPMTLEQESDWYDRVANGQDRYPFAIFERATGRLIGNCGLLDVNWPNLLTSVGIAIGETDARGRGYGTEALRLLLDYCFTVLGMHSVMLTVYEYNQAARRCYEKVGFREIGRRREARWLNGRFWDELYMDILATEFESPVLKRLLDPDTSL